MAGLTGKPLATTYHSLLKVSTTDNQNFDGTVRNIVDGQDTASNLSLTDPSTGQSILRVDGSHANGTAVEIRNSATDGDVTLDFSLDSGAAFTMGIEDGDTDTFKLCHDATLGTDERLSFRSTETVFNEDSGDIDFRIEGNGEANMLFVDAGNDRVAIGTASPAARVHIYANSSTADWVDGLIIDQAGAGDAGMSFRLLGSEEYIMGIDNSDSDRFKICEDSNFSSHNRLTIDTSGKVGIGVPSGTAIPATFSVYGATGDLISTVKAAAGSSDAGALLDLDCGHHGEYTYLRFLTAGDVRGEIYYDSDSTAGDEEMVFYVNDLGSYALRLQADSDGPMNSMGGAPGTDSSLEIIGRSYNGRIPLKLYDDGTGTHHAACNMHFSPIATTVQVPVSGTFDVEFGGGSFQGMFAGEDGVHIQFSGYSSTSGSGSITAIQSWNAVDCSVAAAPSGAKIRFTNSDASANWFRGWIIHAGGVCKITAQTT